MMRKSVWTISLFLIFALLVGLFGFSKEAGAKPRIGVAKFVFDIESVGDGIADILTRELVKSGRFEVIERTELETLLSEIDFQQSEYVEGESAVPLGKVEGVDYILIGKITFFGYEEKEKAGGGAIFGKVFGGGGIKAKTKKARAQFDIRLVDVKTGKVVFADVAEGVESKKGIVIAGFGPGWLGGIDFDSREFRDSMIGKATYKAIGKVLLKLYQKFPLEGDVLARIDDRVVVNLAESSGIKVGDILDVYKVDVITDDKGNVVWEDRKKIGTIKVIAFQGTNLMAEIITGRNDISEGCKVRPQKETIYLPEEVKEELSIKESKEE